MSCLNNLSTYVCYYCGKRYSTQVEVDRCAISHSPVINRPEENLRTSITAEGNTVAIEDTLKERGSRYGEFEKHAEISQSLQSVMRAAENWEKLKDDQKEALTIIVHKIARILNGDPEYHDSWHDICGYSKLVADRILKETK